MASVITYVCICPVQAKSDHSDMVSRRMGFIPLPLSCLVRPSPGIDCDVHIHMHVQLCTCMYMSKTLSWWDQTSQRSLDGDCFELVSSHQQGISITCLGFYTHMVNYNAVVLYLIASHTSLKTYMYMYVRYVLLQTWYIYTCIIFMYKLQFVTVF